jgi:hypothetical protein
MTVGAQVDTLNGGDEPGFPGARAGPHHERGAGAGRAPGHRREPGRSGVGVRPHGHRFRPDGAPRGPSRLGAHRGPGPLRRRGPLRGFPGLGLPARLHRGAAHPAGPAVLLRPGSRHGGLLPRPAHRLPLRRESVRREARTSTASTTPRRTRVGRSVGRGHPGRRPGVDGGVPDPPLPAPLLQGCRVRPGGSTSPGDRTAERTVRLGPPFPPGPVHRLPLRGTPGDPRPLYAAAHRGTPLHRGPGHPGTRGCGQPLLQAPPPCAG